MKKRLSSSQIIKKRGKKQKNPFKRLLFFGFIFFFVFLLSVSVAGVLLYLHIAQDLPKISKLEDYRPPVVTSVFSDDNRKIAEFYDERRILVPLSDIPEQLIQAFIAAEDSRFFKHPGIDLLSIIRAFFKNLEAGTIVQGGSTITQQVTKSFFLTPERSYRRKIKEAILAWRIDKSFSKEEILYLYLNQIYLGHGAYGVAAAAENYFGKSVKDLNLAESAMLAGLPQAPSRYSPFRNPKKAKERQIYVLNRMVAEKYITNIEATKAINTKLDIKPRKNWFIEEVPIYTEQVRRYVEKKYGRDLLYRGGLKIYTCVNIEMQKAAQEEVEKGLRALDKRQGYRGPVDRIPEEEIKTFCLKLQEEVNRMPIETGRIVRGVVTGIDDKKRTVKVCTGDSEGIIEFKDLKWARPFDTEKGYWEVKIRRPSQVLSKGDVIMVKVLSLLKEGLYRLALEQTPMAQAALLCIETETGFVKAMVGGRDFKSSQFNRAIQARRQPGSAFKPIIYAAAIDKGYTPATVIVDSPVVYEDLDNNFIWKPKNYKKTFFGPTLLRTALAHSRNIVTIKILKDIGIDYVISYAKKLGIESELSHNLSIALGSSGVSLFELVRAYSVFANSGYLVQPTFITKIVDRNGNVIEEYIPSRTKVIEKSTAYIITSLLESVVKEGTGRRVKALGRPVAGKTGTTNNLFDAWFIGYTPRYVTGVWVGFDEGGSLGKSETGSRAASPIWLEFMKKAEKDKPVMIFKVPDDIVFAKIDAETGLLPAPESKKVVFECFKKGTVPTEQTSRPRGIVQSEEDFFKSDM